MLILVVDDEHQIIKRCPRQESIWIALIKGPPCGLLKLAPFVLTCHIEDQSKAVTILTVPIGEDHLATEMCSAIRQRGRMRRSRKIIST